MRVKRETVDNLTVSPFAVCGGCRLKLYRFTLLCDLPVCEIKIAHVQRVTELHALGQNHMVAGEDVGTYGEYRNLVRLLLLQILKLL